MDKSVGFKRNFWAQGFMDPPRGVSSTAGSGRNDGEEEGAGTTRREFLCAAAGAFSAVGLVATWPLLDQMNPSAPVRAEASLEFDMSSVPLGQEVSVAFRGVPVFVRHRTPEEIQAASSVPLDELRDPETDSSRLVPCMLGKNGPPGGVYKPEWLVVVGVCTHLGCVPTPYEGKYRGWFCSCHGSQYDTAGRVRKGPAPYNLVVPDYKYVADERILLMGVPEAGAHRRGRSSR